MLFPDWSSSRYFGGTNNYTVKEDGFCVVVKKEGTDNIYVNGKELAYPTGQQIISIFARKDDVISSKDSLYVRSFSLVKSGGGLESYFLIVSLLSIMLDSLLNTEEVKHNV